jgi:hypothetical protein
MNRSGMATICAVLLGGAALASCSTPEVRVSAPDASAYADASASPGTAASPGTTVDAAVQQRVKNMCMEQLKAQASGATPAPGQLHVQKVTLIKVEFLGEIKQIPLPKSASGYELGIEFVYKVGSDDSRTGRKSCKVNLTDSTVDWQWIASP